MRNKASTIQLGAGFRLLIISLIVIILQPAPILITPGPKLTVQSTRPLLGVHTRLTDEVEPWKIQRTLQMVRQMGANWIVEFFPWAYYHAKDGGFAWQHPDLVVDHANAQGLMVIARLGLTPAWARPPDTPLTYLDEEGYKDFAVYAAAFAKRYCGRVQYIIVGNEPNLSYEWGYRKISASLYVDLLRSIYPAVKSSCPQIGVLAGALAPNLEPVDSPWATGDLEYLQQMYDAGAAEFFDGLAVHAYGLSFPADADPGDELLNFRRVELVRQVMIDNDDSDAQIFITESGWNDHPRWTMAVRPGQRIQYTLDSLQIAEDKWPFVEMVAIWAFRYPAPVKSYPDNYTLVTPEFITKPIYEALQTFSGN